MKEKLKPLKVDIDFIDPGTLKKVCSFNQCINKFTATGFVQVPAYPKNPDSPPKNSYFHACVDCGRRHISKKDKQRNIDSFLGVVCGNPPECSDHLEFLKGS